MHKHTITVDQGPLPYASPVRGPDERGYEPRAHGGCRHVQVCRCGAARTVNYSAGFAEVGAWREATGVGTVPS